MSRPPNTDYTTHRPGTGSRFHHDDSYQDLPAYSQEGILFTGIFHNLTEATVFGDFIDELLCHGGRWLELKPVLVMDNASFYHSEWTSRMCTDAEVKLAYFPRRLPDLNPIEEFFAELEDSIRRN